MYFEDYVQFKLLNSEKSMTYDLGGYEDLGHDTIMAAYLKQVQ